MTTMHGCEVISGNWHVELGRGRRLQRQHRQAIVQGSVDESIRELLMDTNRASAVLDAPEYSSDTSGSEVSSSSLWDGVSLSSGYLSTPTDYSVDTPSTLSSPLGNTGGMKRAGWQHFSGRSRAPSPWPDSGQNGDVELSCFGRLVRAAKDSFKKSRLGKLVLGVGRIAESCRSSISGK